MQTFDQQRSAAMARFAASKALATAKAEREATLKRMKREGQLKALMVTAGIPMVRSGGKGLSTLREDVFDASNNTNGRAGLVQDTDATYDSAMMGGEPYAIWN